jgi:phosphoglycerate dehydrogenase-like enzyme
MHIGYVGMKSSFAMEMVERLRVQFPGDQFVECSTDKADPGDEIEVLLAMGSVRAEVFKAHPKLGLLQMTTAGYDGVEVEAATRAGVWVASAPTGETGNGESVAEHAVLLMLAASRRLNEELAFARAKGEGRTAKPEGNRALFGKTVCIVGLGGIGELLVERLRGFQMILTGVDGSPQDAPEGVKAYGEDELTMALGEADYVVLALPATKENENLFNAKVLGAMKKQAILVNVARGTLVDEAALLEAVESGALYGAGLDVVKEEPVHAGNPLLGASRIVVTPHIAGSTDVMLEGSVRFLTKVLENYRKGLKSAGVVNEPENPRVGLQ